MKIKKIVSILLLLIMLLTNITKVFALSFENGKVITLSEDHDCISVLKIQGKDILKQVVYVVYTDPSTGKKQPAFCVEPDQVGVGTGAGSSYDVTLKLMEDQRLWRILYKGYMGTSYSYWGLECDDDLYYATKTAVHCLVDGSTPKTKYEIPHRVGRGDNVSLAEVQRRGSKVLDVAEEIYNYGINGSYNYVKPTISANKSGTPSEQSINGTKYLVQNYSVTANRILDSFNISIQNFPTGTKIFNSLNIETNFITNNNFKIAIPVSNIIENITGYISITNANVKTYPVFYAKAYLEEIQDYITYADPVESTSTATSLSLNAFQSGIEITKVDDITKETLSGVTFNIKYTDTNENIGTFTTNSSGKITVNGLRQGNITITETSTLENYILNTTPINLTLEYNQIKNIVVDNTHKQGNLKIIKIDSDNNELRIPDVEFQLLDSSNNIVGTFKTDNNGEINIQGLRTGTYTLKETKEISLYYPLDKDITVNIDWNKTTEKSIQNEKLKGQINLIKVDKEHHEIKIPDVTFEIIDSKDNVVETITTNENGEAKTSRLPIGTYRIKETSTDVNYILDEQNIKVEIKKDSVTEQIIENAHKKGNVQIYKVDKDNHKITLGNVKFELYSEEFKSVVGEYFTDVNGEIYIENLRTGNYKLIEKETGKWYNLAEDTDINVSWDTTQNTVIENELKKGKIKIIKVDKDNNEVKLKDIIFDVLDENSNLLETITTDANGEAITKSYSVRDYEKLYIREISTNENYFLDDSIHTIVLEANQIKDITFENEKIKGTLEITKVDKTDNSKLLSNVTFGIYNSKDELIQTITTDESGKATSNVLFKGNYYCKELNTNSKYYLLNTETYKFEISKDSTDIKLTIDNTPVDITVDVDKSGDIEVRPDELVNYTFSNIANNSNIYLDNFKWFDYIPTDYVRVQTGTTGTFNQNLIYSIYYKTNITDDYILFKGNLSTLENYSLDFNQILLDENEYINEFYFDFGKVETGFKEEISPTLQCKTLSTLEDSQTFTNRTKTVGIYEELNAEANSDWTTIVHIPEKPEIVLPRTGK